MSKWMLALCTFSLTLAVAGCDDDDDSAAGGTSGATQVDMGTGGGGGGGTAGAGGGGVGGSAGEGGAGGTAGAGGVEPGVATFCQEACVADEDCLENFACRDARCVAADPAAAAGCVNDIDCVPPMSGWTFAVCTADTDCIGGDTGGSACVVFANGDLGCALRPSEFIVCVDIGMDEVEWETVSGERLIVCANEAAYCTDDSTCDTRCATDEDCPFDEYPACNVTTGRCGCTADSCVTNSSVCGDDGLCKCANDGDCSGDGVDICYDGYCGCSAGSVCTADGFNPGTTMVCEPFVIPGQ